MYHVSARDPPASCHSRCLGIEFSSAIMSEPAVVFDKVWKKFRRGERHDSLRDAVMALAKAPFSRRRSADSLDDEEFWALRDVSFEVKPGEAIGIIGPNGAGKSTALKLLSKILKPTMGECHVRGRVGALIEISAGFHPDLTGRENLYLQGAILGMTRPEVTRKLDAIVDFAGIRPFIDTPVKRYSSGMNARLGFAIAAHIDPEVLLIDEVLAVGDFVFQQKCFARLAEFRRSGASIVFVSHNMQAIVSLCDRALLLRPGRGPVLASVGEVAALYANPDGEAVDARIRMDDVRLAEFGQRETLKKDIAPHTALTLDATFTANAPLPRCRVGFEIVRSDGLVMFNGSPMVDGAPSVDLEAGMSLGFRIHFRANVLRGTYRVVLHVSDTNNLWPPIAVSGLAAFVVHETTRVAGCAEVEPSYELKVSAKGETLKSSAV
jgi:lipopolysaccharide transport system ATP-binding protein